MVCSTTKPITKEDWFKYGHGIENLCDKNGTSISPIYLQQKTKILHLPNLRFYTFIRGQFSEVATDTSSLESKTLHPAPSQ
jgi:hypothetical protein